MRRFAIAVLAATQSLVLSGIVACCLQLSQQMRTNASLARVARAVLTTTRHLANDVRLTIRRRA